MADSLRGQLMQWLLPPLVALLGLDTYLAYRTALNAVTAAYDRSLIGAARAIADGVTERAGLAEVDLPYSAFEIFESQVKERIYYNVVTDAGTVIAGYSDLPRLTKVAYSGGEPAFMETEFRGEHIRIVAISKRLYGSASAASVIVQVAETMVSRDLLVRNVLTDSIRRQLMQLAVTVLFLWLGIARGLQPLRTLRKEIQSRPATDLSPVETSSVQREVRPLIDAFNQHTERVSSVLAAQERFISDAAHQLRTPLTLLRTQAELLQRTTDDAAKRELIEAMVRATDQAVRLAKQLLAMARTEPGAHSEEWGPIPLERVASEVMLEYSAQARAKAIDIGFECTDEACNIVGNRTLIHELIANLVDNAIRYTPPSGNVTGSVQRAGQYVLLSIRDSGPGIPKTDRDKVFERFYRVAGTAADGSGLGLAIARQVCASHGASINLSDAQPGPVPGLLVEVRFPINPELAPVN